MGKFKQGFFNPKYPDKWVISNKGITKGKGIRYMLGIKGYEILR